MLTIFIKLNQNIAFHSLFSFTNTDVASPADIDTSCLTIDNSTLGTSYLGKLLIEISPLNIKELLQFYQF